MLSYFGICNSKVLGRIQCISCNLISKKSIKDEIRKNGLPSLP